MRAATADASPPRSANFADRLDGRAAAVRSAMCAGIDPAPGSLALLTDAGDAIAGRLERFGGMIIESVRDVAVAVKFQVAWYELHGAEGMLALERSIRYARRAGLLVIADAKRGDIPHSAAAYAEAWLAAGSPLQSDALTVNASVGRDALAAMSDIAHANGAQVYALVHTSNPGATQLQAVRTADGTPWWHLLAGIVDDCGAGAVVGATHPEVFQQARTAMPQAPLLIPGVGAQGGTVDDLEPLVSEDAPLVLVAASRSLLPDQAGTTGAFRQAVAEQATALAADTAQLLPRRVVLSG